MSLGLDRLKSALVAMGLKCGGYESIRIMYIIIRVHVHAYTCNLFTYTCNCVYAYIRTCTQRWK